MSDIAISKAGRIGRITLTRPQALNALSLEMIRQIAAILPVWAADNSVAMVAIDAVGERAFCAGGDIAGVYRALVAGDPVPARQLWREEYPMNAALARYPKPVASFLHGFTLGGGVGLGGHCSHRVVGATSRMAMPECGIGFIPDVGGSLLLARAPGRLGEYLGTTSRRMGPGDAILAGFADYYIEETGWPELIARLEETGDAGEIGRAAGMAPESALAGELGKIDAHFGAETFAETVASLRADGGDWAGATLEMLAKNAPLSMAATVELVHRVRALDRIDAALELEYRFGHRITEMGEFQEGIRAAVIDKDRSPRWRHATLDATTPGEVAAMLAPLGADALKLEAWP